MKNMISSICSRAAGIAVAATLALSACGNVETPEQEPPAQTQPSQNQVTSAAGVTKGARFTMRVQVGHAYSQKPTTGARKLGSATPINKGSK